METMAYIDICRRK